MSGFNGFSWFFSGTTGLFKSNLDTLIGDYDKCTVYTEKIMADLFSVHMEISFYDNNSEKI